MTSVVLVDAGGTVVEYVTAEEYPQQVGWKQTQAIVTLSLQLTTKSSFLHLILLLKTFYDCLVLFPSLNTFAIQEEECEVDMEYEGEVEGECEAEEAYEEVQEREEAEDYPAVIVEEVPGANLAEEQGYSAQVVVYEDEAYLMQEVGDEQEVETEGEAGET